MGRFKIEVGGSVDPGLASTSKWKNRDTEPVWFHQKPYAFLDNLCHSIFAKAVVDFSPAHGEMAMVALRRRLPYVGITCSAAHATALHARLVSLVKDAIVDPDDKLHMPDMDQSPAPAKKQKVDPEKKNKQTAAKGNIMQKLKEMMAAGGKGGANDDDDDAEENEDDDPKSPMVE